MIGQASDGVEAIDRLSDERADIAVRDLRMPRLNGIQATRAIRALWPGVLVLGLSEFRPNDLAARAITDAGADAIVSKSEGSDRIIAQILALSAGAECPA